MKAVYFARPIAGVSFLIADSSGKVLGPNNGIYTTDKNGRIHVNLDAGNYYAVEIEGVKGFKADTTPHYFAITTNNYSFSLGAIPVQAGERVTDVYFGTWETATASWTTVIINLNKPPKLPKTGY